MKILLTGHKGFIGSNLLKRLLDDGHHVETFDWQAPPAWPHITKDLDWVIHVGANSSTTERDTRLLNRQNVVFTEFLYHQCKEYNIPMQFASSASVYGTTTSPSHEKDDLDPQSPYAWTKYHAESILTTDPDSRVQIFRYFNVYGHGEEHKGSQASVFTKFPRQGKETGLIKLFEGSDKVLRDFVCVDDVVEFHMQMLKTNHRGIFNVGTGNPISFQHIANVISSQLDCSIEYVPMPNELINQYQYYTCADTTWAKTVSKVNWTNPIEWIHKNVNRSA
jgi:ADP-L-glycero-D-manno-heptose 6-epimerase